MVVLLLPLRVYTLCITIQNILLSSSSHTVVYLSFEEESISMDENSGTVNVCLILSDVIELTQSDIWATVVSIQDTAMSTCVKGMVCVCQ